MEDILDAPVKIDEHSYSSFGKRCLAFLIDVAILMCCLILLSMLGIRNPMLLLLLSFGYSSVSESSEWQCTIGKRLMGIIVTDLKGERISLSRASLRFLGKILSILPLFMGFFIVAFTSRRQALHDLLSQTLVVSDKTSDYDKAV